MKINLGRHAIANSKASAPSTAEITGQPSIRSVMTRASRQSVLSSTTKIKFLFSVMRPISKLFSQGKASRRQSLFAANRRVQYTIKHARVLSGFALLVPSSKCLCPDEQIVAQTRVEESKQKRVWSLYRPSILSTRATCAGLPVIFPPRTSRQTLQVVAVRVSVSST